MTAPRPRLLLGAYALGTPTDPDAWPAALAGLDIDGLEHPLPPADGPDTDAARLHDRLPPGWDLLVTCVPTVMSRLGDDPGYGLGSTSPAGREAAVDDVRRAFALAERLADLAGRQRVLAVEVHSAPGPDRGSAAALAQSLTELAAASRAGAAIVLEHCDATVPGQTAAKGFWSLEAEIDVVRRVGAPDVGIGLNWGRSAVEGRDPGRATDHARTAAASGLLRTAVLSGAADREGPWGPAWSDSHIPPRGTHPALAPSADSLLGADEVAAFLAAAGPVPVVAAKVAARPRSATTAELIGVARATTDLVRAALDAQARA